jgi:hypothetical protein
VKVGLVHPHRVTCEVLCRTLTKKLDAQVVGFSSIEDLLDSSMSYDAFVLYNMFGREKMDRWEGIKWIRHLKPEALIISMIHKRFFDRKDAPPGADARLVGVGGEIESIAKLIQAGYKGKSFVLVSGHTEQKQ